MSNCRAGAAKALYSDAWSLRGARAGRAARDPPRLSYVLQVMRRWLGFQPTDVDPRMQSTNLAISNQVSVASSLRGHMALSSMCTKTKHGTKHYRSPAAAAAARGRALRRSASRAPSAARAALLYGTSKHMVECMVEQLPGAQQSAKAKRNGKAHRQSAMANRKGKAHRRMNEGN